MERRLINCPFCSGAPQLASAFGGAKYWVRCTQCGVRGPERDLDRDAMEAWNRRGGIGHTTISHVNPRVPIETYKYIDRTRDYLERLENGELGTPYQGFIVQFDGVRAEISKLRMSDGELEAIAAAVSGALRTKSKFLKSL